MTRRFKCRIFFLIPQKKSEKHDVKKAGKRDIQNKTFIFYYI